MPSLHTRWWLFDMQTPMEEKTSRRDFCLHNFKKTPTFSLHRVRRRKKQASTYFSRNFQERSHTEKKEEWRMIWSRFSSFSSSRKTLHRERKRKRERERLSFHAKHASEEKKRSSHTQTCQKGLKSGLLPSTVRPAKNANSLHFSPFFIAHTLTLAL